MLKGLPVLDAGGPYFLRASAGAPHNWGQPLISLMRRRSIRSDETGECPQLRKTGGPHSSEILSTQALPPPRRSPVVFSRAPT